MRFSEAIREGSKRVPQAFGHTFDRNALGEISAACAVGAATLALGFEGLDMDRWIDLAKPMAAVMEEWGKAECPECLSSEAHLWALAAHLNDRHTWTREAIADYAQAQEAIHGIGQDAPAEKRELVGA